MTDPALAIELPLEQRILLGQCINDLTAVLVFRDLTDDLLTVGAARAPLEMTPELAVAMSRLGEENVARWQRLKDAGPFIVSLGDHLRDGHIEAALTAAGQHNSGELTTFLQRAQQEGGPAAFVRSRLGRIPTEFADELDQAIGLYRYFATWPDGFRAASPAEFAAHTAFGCALGIADITAGGVGIGVALAAEVLTVGVSTPVSVALVGASSVAIGGGSAIVTDQC